MNRKCILALTFCILILALSSLTQSATANVRLEGAGDLPYYARTDEDPFHNDQWAVIVFYRPPACVPNDFNLMEFFDIPGALSCAPYTTDGFAVWENGPAIDPAPIQVKLFGLGTVPVWFTSWPEMEDEIADGMLYIPELEAMPSLLKGSAYFYEETLHPSEMITFKAKGYLEDGRTFSVEATATGTATTLRNMVTHIVFK